MSDARSYHPCAAGASDYARILYRFQAVAHFLKGDCTWIPPFGGGWVDAGEKEVRSIAGEDYLVQRGSKATLTFPSTRIDIFPSPPHRERVKQVQVHAPLKEPARALHA